MSIELVSSNSADTEMLGEALGRLLEAGDIVCLYGELGSGKTTLTRGLARGLGVASERAVRSPSFVLMQRYQGRVPVYHVDLYRLEGPADMADIGLRDVLGGDGVAVIEWADKMETLAPVERLDITMAHRTEETRLIRLVPRGTRHGQIIKGWQSRSAAQGKTGVLERDDSSAVSP
jgi:tRNA threonylcarbamoyladenosine biosynthesis protein TsaE